MATSHYCHGKWRSGSVESCTKHEKLAKKQTNVYKGVGNPGGRSSSSGGSKSTADKKPSKGSSGSSSKDSSS